jgi:hypothetical protein
MYLAFIIRNLICLVSKCQRDLQYLNDGVIPIAVLKEKFNVGILVLVFRFYCYKLILKEFLITRINKK